MKKIKDIEIELRNIKKGYGSQSVLNGVSLRIDNTSFISICGKSGSGKSTLMNILGLIEGYDAGEYLFNQQKIEPGKDYYLLRRNYIGFIYQSYNLIPEKTCYENIILPAMYAGMKQAEIDTYISSIVDRLEISHLLQKGTFALSGGEKQRVAIARSLILNPSLIVADEPTGNLDTHNRDAVMEILLHEHRNGRGIVLITHDEAVADYADEKIYLKDGKLSIC